MAVEPAAGMTEHIWLDGCKQCGGGSAVSGWYSAGGVQFWGSVVLEQFGAVHAYATPALHLPH